MISAHHSIESIERTNNTNTMDTASGQMLRLQVKNRRDSLTLPESRFLELVAEFGTDSEISCAKEKLMDGSLFFEPKGLNKINHRVKHINDDITNVLTQTEEKSPDPAVEGSTRRQEYLEHRKRRNSTHDGIWKARESGISLSRESSRRSLHLVSRRSSASFSVNMHTKANTLPYGAMNLHDRYTSMDDSIVSRASVNFPGTSKNNGTHRRRSIQEIYPNNIHGNPESGTRSIKGRRSSLQCIPRKSIKNSCFRSSLRSSQRMGSLLNPEGCDLISGRCSIRRSQLSISSEKNSSLHLDALSDDSDMEEDEDSHMEPRENNAVKSTQEINSCSSSFSSDLPPQIPKLPLQALRASRNVYCGEGFEVFDSELSLLCAIADLEDSYADSLEDDSMDDRSAKSDGHQYDPWDSFGDESDGINFDFGILGTSAQDESAQPHVLSPPIMDSLQDHLPFSKRGESFWLKYSMVRDGSSAHTFLQKVRGSKYTILAMETVDGEVFGAFTAEPWHITHGYFGTGESFVWKMNGSRSDSCKSVLEQAEMESDIEVFRSSFENRCMQICKHDRIAVGGGAPAGSIPREIQSSSGGKMIQPNEWGFALAFEGDSLLEATSSPCITFNSPSLSKFHTDGSLFELVNVEAWTLTPCITVEQAEMMESSQLFLKKHVVQ